MIFLIFNDFFYLKDLFKLEQSFRTKFFLEKLKFSKMKRICDPEKFPVKQLNQAKDQKPIHFNEVMKIVRNLYHFS